MVPSSPFGRIGAHILMGQAADIRCWLIQVKPRLCAHAHVRHWAPYWAHTQEPQYRTWLTNVGMALWPSLPHTWCDLQGRVRPLVLLLLLGMNLWLYVRTVCYHAECIADLLRSAALVMHYVSFCTPSLSLCLGLQPIPTPAVVARSPAPHFTRNEEVVLH
ncbi:hypothetical protein F5148DRAFT_316317 [Russula earlei]|uniref:Uncharacterized protein n=1 Tax=Russula earlei TaxID=71964 RepID=A0ACC0U206_9AGAM|nr:hypothetical protein F5148DRAFT_316317 [Russula earlei]